MKRPYDEPYHIVMEIVNKRCKVLRILKEVGIQRFNVIDVRGIAEGITRHLVRMPTKQIEKVPETMLVKTWSSRKIAGETSSWLDSNGCDVCNTILSHGSFLIAGRNIEDHTIVYSFIAPNFDAFKGIISTLEDNGLKPKVLEVGKYKRKGKILTEKQERTLWLALKMGFFEYPRKIHTVELSRRLGIGPSTLSEITRRGIRRLLKHHFET